VQAKFLVQDTIQRLKLPSLLETSPQVSVLSSSEMEDCKTKFFHQFILAGAFRMLRRGRFRDFHQVMQLLKLGMIKDLKPTKKWKLVRIVFEIMYGGYNLVM
jgi:hypothetical protein